MKFCCRTCLVHPNSIIPITDDMYEFMEFFMRLQCLPRSHPIVEVPQNVCTDCFENITNFKSFCEQSKAAEESYKVIFMQGLKSNKSQIKECLRKEEFPLQLYKTDIINKIDAPDEAEENYDNDENEYNECNNESNSVEAEYEDDFDNNENNWRYEEILEDDNYASPNCDEDYVDNDLISVSISAIDASIEEEFNACNDEAVEATMYEDFDAAPAIGNGDDNSVDNDNLLSDLDMEIEFLNNTNPPYTLTRDKVMAKKLRYKPKENKLEKPCNKDSNLDFGCRYCDKRFKKFGERRNHEKMHTKPYKCEVCGRGFGQQSILRTHQALHYGKEVLCPICGKQFSRSSQLILHNRMHDNEKPFVCEYEGCGAAFRLKQYLNAHNKRHSGVKEYKCKLCSAEFFNATNLRGHFYNVHSSSIYQCDLCSKKFRRPLKMREHLKHAHDVNALDISHLKKKSDVQ